MNFEKSLKKYLCVKEIIFSKTATLQEPLF